MAFLMELRELSIERWSDGENGNWYLTLMPLTWKITCW